MTKVRKRGEETKEIREMKYEISFAIGTSKAETWGMTGLKRERDHLSVKNRQTENSERK